MSKKICATCEHFVSTPIPEEDPPDFNGGRCRRYPPRPKMSAGAYLWGFPVVMSDDVCGEWVSGENEIPDPTKQCVQEDDD